MHSKGILPCVLMLIMTSQLSKLIDRLKMYKIWYLKNGTRLGYKILKIHKSCQKDYIFRCYSNNKCFHLLIIDTKEIYSIIHNTEQQLHLVHSAFIKNYVIWYWAYQDSRSCQIGVLTLEHTATMSSMHTPFTFLHMQTHEVPSFLLCMTKFGTVLFLVSWHTFFWYLAHLSSSVYPVSCC